MRNQKQNKKTISLQQKKHFYISKNEIQEFIQKISHLTEDNSDLPSRTSLSINVKLFFDREGATIAGE